MNKKEFDPWVFVLVAGTLFAGGVFGGMLAAGFVGEWLADWILGLSFLGVFGTMTSFFCWLWADWFRERRG